MKNIQAKTGLTILSILFLFFIASSQAEGRAPRKVNCDKGKTIQDQLDKAQDGDVIEVSGDCSENIVIGNNRITLQAVGAATLDGPDTTKATIDIQGLNTTISDFASISGGRNVIQVRRGASAVIDGNTIKDGRRAILVNQGAYARIVDNIIGNFLNPLTFDGITVRQSAAADIISNDITENGGNGIRVEDGASADIDDNDIANNGGDGILVRRTSAIRLSQEGSLGLANRINGNTGRGVQCQTNSSIRSGTAQDFTGGNTGGNTLIAASCVVSGAL